MPDPTEKWNMAWRENQISWAGAPKRDRTLLLLLNELIAILKDQFATGLSKQRLCRFFTGRTYGIGYCLESSGNVSPEQAYFPVHFGGEVLIRQMIITMTTYIASFTRNKKWRYFPGLKFFFQCGNMDETMDRNKNGIIDSIDDTLDLIQANWNKRL